MARIGILGGSFNPIHLAHLVMAEQARESLSLDRVLFIPTHVPPHKAPESLASAEDRLAMVRLAIEDNAAFEADDVELRREGTTYSIDTIEALRARYGPAVELFFLIGFDTVVELPSWREIRRLAAQCSFVPVRRPGVPDPRLNALEAAIGTSEARAILARCLPMPLLDISASDIRRRVEEGRTIRYLVPRRVEEYIREKGLFLRPQTVS